jgi:hypothetical protein
MTRRFIRIDTKKPFELTEELRILLAKSGWIASLWHTDDVQNERPDLTFEQRMEVLEQCMRKHDAEIGINWEVIRFHAHDLFPARDAAARRRSLDVVKKATGGSNV